MASQDHAVLRERQVDRIPKSDWRDRQLAQPSCISFARCSSITDYILLFLKSPHFIETGIPKMTGTAGQKRVHDRSTSRIRPFPSHRSPSSAASSPRSMSDGRCATGWRRRGRRARRRATGWRRRASPASTRPIPKLSSADARFALDALPALTTRPDQIKQLRQTILNLAVRGKLVPQDPNDEPASELLKRIAKREGSGSEAGRDQDAEAIPYALPEIGIWAAIPYD